MSARLATGASERGELFTPKGEIYNDSSKEADISQNESKDLNQILCTFILWEVELR